MQPVVCCKIRILDFVHSWNAPKRNPGHVPGYGLYRISETRVRDQGKYATSADVAVPGKEKEIL